MIGCVGAPRNQELVLIDCAGFPGVSGMQLDVSGNAGKARWQIDQSEIGIRREVCEGNGREYSKS